MVPERFQQTGQVHVMPSSGLYRNDILVGMWEQQTLLCKKVILESDNCY